VYLFLKLFYGSLLLILFYQQQAFANNKQCHRIVSLAPGLTGIVESLKLTKNIVGVSDFDQVLNDQNNNLPRVGNLFSLHHEPLLAVSPSIVFLLDEQKSFINDLNKLNLKVEICDLRSISSIDACIKKIGKVCEKEEEAKQVLDGIKQRLHRVIKSLKQKNLDVNKRVLLVIGSSLAGAGTRQLFVSGKDGYFYELLKLGGYVPVYDGPTGGLLGLQPEALSILKPEVIIHIMSPAVPLPSKDQLFDLWSNFATLPAVQKKNIFASNHHTLSLPGVDYPEALKILGSTIKGSS
jgi:iron complex transport system substrate-binding protein